MVWNLNLKRLQQEPPKPSHPWPPLPPLEFVYDRQEFKGHPKILLKERNGLGTRLALLESLHSCTTPLVILLKPLQTNNWLSCHLHKQ